MIKLDDRLTIRNKVLEGLKSSFPWLGNQVSSLRMSSHGKTQTDRLINENKGNSDHSDNENLAGRSQPGESLDLPVADESAGLATERFYRLPTLQEILSDDNFREPYSILLGLCDDGLPLTLDFTNPAPGSVLITSDPRAGKTRLIHAILNSVALINSTDQVLFNVITTDIHEYTDLAELPNCQRLAAHDSKAAARIIRDLFEQSEQRRSAPSQLSYILVIEELAGFLQAIDTETFTQLMRLIKHGPRLGIWVFASISSTMIEQLDPAILDAFRTHLLGYIADPELACYLSRTEDCPSQELTCGSQFCAFVGGQWFSFWICENNGDGL